MDRTMGDPINVALNARPGGFSLINYIETPSDFDNFSDHSLMDHLGISLPLDSNTPVPVPFENNSKLLLSGSEYTTLQPPVAQSGVETTSGQTQYITIDTEEAPFFGNDDSNNSGNDSPTSLGVNPQGTGMVNSANNVAPVVMTAGNSSLPLVLNASDQIFIIADGPLFETPSIPTSPAQATVPVEAQATSPIPAVLPMEDVIATGTNELLSSPKPTTPSTKSSQPKPRSRRQRPKKPKKYELLVELDDPQEEKKRLNAINAKKNRDKKRDKLKELGEKVDAVTKERDQLQREVEELKRRERQLREQLAQRNNSL